ncbi:hypothetical protein L4C42_16245 [Vibrio wakamikoensis]|uniref:hypothetical protein n=1 Tax=Vibrio wakamikoensis TaxID=2910251 RepID=UPI003D1C4678
MKLRSQDSDKSKETMIRCAARWLRAYEYISGAIVVLEECSESVLPDMQTRRLHLHIFTVLNSNEQELARREFLLGKRTRIQLQTTWTDRRPYTSDDEWEEEEFGTMPKDKVDEGAEHWLNTYTREVVNKTTGKVSKEVCRVLPVCSRAVDYMTKNLERPIGRGKNYTILGLEGHRERRKELARLGRELLAE